MILKMKQISHGEDEVIIHYREMNEQIEAIANLVQGTSQKICAQWEKQTLLLKLPTSFCHVKPYNY